MSKNVRCTKVWISRSLMDSEYWGKSGALLMGKAPGILGPESVLRWEARGQRGGGNGTGTERGSQCTGPRLLGARGYPPPSRRSPPPLAAAPPATCPALGSGCARTPPCPPPAPSAAAEPSASRSPGPFALRSLSFSVTAPCHFQ